MGRSTRVVFSRPERAEWTFVASALRTETVGGALLLVAAMAALVWANSPGAGTYRAVADHVLLPVRDLALGPVHIGLDLTVRAWTGDGLLAVFFFVVGLELKRELVGGALRRPAEAALPIAAAVGGMAVPALVYLGVVLSTGDTEALAGWGVPVATDIAFALAVLAVLSTWLPSSLRLFLLTLAVVDDLLAIIVIAVFYTDGLQPAYLALAALPLAGFALAVRRRLTAGYVLVPLALLTWLFVHESGVHATIAGVALGVLVPAARPDAPDRCLAKHFEHLWRPVSAGVAVPVFALFAAGVDLRGGGLGAAATDGAALAVVAGLVLGKPVGVLGVSALVVRFTRARLDPDIAWRDLAGLSLLTGIGFTVSLLVAELAFPGDAERVEHVRAGVIAGSLIAAALAGTVLVTRGRHYRRLHRQEMAEEAARRTAQSAGMPSAP